MASLKPFVLNLDDLNFLLDQITFQPLFDLNGNAIINWDGVGTVYDGHGALIGTGGALVGDENSLAAILLYGQSYASTTDLRGLRDVTGYNNNLLQVHAGWGAVDQPFVRTVEANYGNYSQQDTSGIPDSYQIANGGFAAIDWDRSTPGIQSWSDVGSNYAPTITGSGSSAIVALENVVDYTPRMISQTITTGGMTMLTEGDLVGYAGTTPNHIVYNTPSLSDGVTANPNYDPDGIIGQAIVADYGSLLTTLGHTDYQKVGETRAPNTDTIYYDLIESYKAIPDTDGTLYGDGSGGPLADGGGIWVFDPAPVGLPVGTHYQIPGAVWNGAQYAAGAPATIPGSTDYFIGAENPGVAPTNGWFALFGQFFDHGLDFIDKSSGKTIKIALAQDDPLYGVTGPDGRPATSITITRATPAGVDANGDVNYVNHTSPFIDQSQTYGSSEQVTNLLREWVSTDSGVTYHAGMKMFDGTTLATPWTRNDGAVVTDTLPTLSELRDQVLDTNRDALTWEDVSNLRNRNANGDIDTGLSDQALLLDMNPRFDGARLDATTAVGTSTVDALVDAALATLSASLTGSGFAFSRIGGGTSGGIQLVVTGGAGGLYLPDGTYTGASALAPWVNFANFSITAPAGAVHDAVGQILMASVGDHYIAGDGRVNENFGLTAIHHVFHEEHNTQIRSVINTINAQDAAEFAANGNHDVLHKWQINNNLPANNTDANGNYLNADGSIAWDQDKMFNAAKLIVEMEYQHAAIDQYARTITPHILEVVGYSSGIDPTVSLEFSQAAFRFGHSTLRETIDTIDPTHGLTGKITSYALEQAFLNPGQFAAIGPAAIALGMSHQQMNEVDEFITPALNQGLLGLPLDLAAINIARGRDVGIPTLNEFRGQVGLTQYVSWDDFGRNMIHPESLVNFIAAYAFDGDVAKAQEIVDRFNGVPATGNNFNDAQANAFMLNDAGAPAGADAFNKIDTWIGGLAEAHVPGGILGSTFDLVFVNQMENLINGDRFYYLVRLFGQQFGEEVNNGQFKDIVERNTGLEHLNGSIFAYADKYYEFGKDADLVTDGPQNDFLNHKYGALLADNPTLGMWSDGSANPNSINSNGSLITVGTTQYIRDYRPDLAPDALHPVEGTPTSGAESHEVMVGTNNADFVHMRSGDDTFYGEGGNDKIFGDFGNDRLYGGDGADIIDSGDGADLVDGGAGDDIIYGFGSGTEIGGFDQLVGGSGNDTIYGGEGVDKLSGGAGDDALYGEGNTDPFTHGGDGNDYIDGGSSGDNLYGDAGDDFVYGSDDQDIVQGDDGDDILRPGKPSQAINGGPDEVIGGTGFVDFGFDIMDLSDWDVNPVGTTADLETQFNPLVAVDGTTSFPAWFQMEGVVGTQNNDTLIGTDVLNAAEVPNLFGGSNWLIGGSGSDTLTGAGGNDLIVGGSIRLDSLIGTYSGGYGNEVDGATHRAIGTIGTNGLLDAAALGGAFDKHFTEMLRTERFKDLVFGNGGTDGTADTARFTGDRAQYTIDTIMFQSTNEVTGLGPGGTPLAGGKWIVAYKITDTVVGRDGTDTLIGVEFLEFADGTLAIADAVGGTPGGGDQPATGALNITSYADGGDRATLNATNTLQDPDLVTQENPTGAVLDYQWQQLVGATWQNSEANQPLEGIETGGTFRVTATYTDAAGTHTIVSPETAVVGTAAADTLNGTAGVDFVLGLNGNDMLNGGGDNDILDGGAGADTLNGDAGNDTLYGRGGADTLQGGVGDDTVFGNGGNDTVIWNVGDGNDTVNGGGNGVAGDTFEVFGDASDETFDIYGPGALLGYTGSAQIVVTRTVGFVTAIIGELTNIEELNFHTDGGTNSVAVHGSFVGVLNQNTITISAQGGHVTVDVTQMTSDEHIVLNIGNGTYDIVGNANNQVEVNTTGNTDAGTTDIGFSMPITGSDAYLVGTTGDDIILGADANTVIYADSGADIVTTSSNLGVVVAGGAGADVIDGGDGDDIVFGGDDGDIISTAGGDDKVWGDDGDDLIDGDDGNDLIFGGDGDDDIDGGDGADRIWGGDGADRIAGGAGNDRIESGTGADLIFGGEGNDTFLFRTTVEVDGDTIADFNAGDRIDLHFIDANEGAAGNNTFTLVSGMSFSAAGELIVHYDGAAGQTILQGNTDADMETTEFSLVLNGDHLNDLQNNVGIDL